VTDAIPAPAGFLLLRVAERDVTADLAEVRMAMQCYPVVAWRIGERVVPVALGVAAYGERGFVDAVVAPDGTVVDSRGRSYRSRREYEAAIAGCQATRRNELFEPI